MSHVESSSVSSDIKHIAAVINFPQNDTQSRIYNWYSNDCTIPNCIECIVSNKNEICTLCYGNNIGPDDTGKCVPCQMGNCLQCNIDASSCELCIDGNPPIKDECTSYSIFCNDPNCIYCPNGPDFCAVCDSGYHLDGYCIPCMTIHYDCMECAEGICTECSPTPFLASSMCVACDIIGCQYCRVLYNDRNKSTIKQCISCYKGYILSHDNTVCTKSSETSCALLNCRRCTTTAPITCLECNTSYTLYKDACVVCDIPNCLDCKIEMSQGITYETCMLCDKGYTKLIIDMQSATRQVLCVPVLNNIDQRINPMVFFWYIVIAFALALLSAGIALIHGLIEKDDNCQA